MNSQNSFCSNHICISTPTPCSSLWFLCHKIQFLMNICLVVQRAAEPKDYKQGSPYPSYIFPTVESPLSSLRNCHLIKAGKARWGKTNCPWIVSELWFFLWENFDHAYLKVATDLVSLINPYQYTDSSNLIKTDLSGIKIDQEKTTWIIYFNYSNWNYRTDFSDRGSSRCKVSYQNYHS